MMTNENDSMLGRRKFIRLIGGTLVASAVAPNYLMGAEKKNTSIEGILIEGSNFGDTGGWVVDTQFYQQMGGCYLLAHGMGEPVEDAVYQLREDKEASTVKQKKEYYLFVRTKNWCPGQWQAPGRFKVLINGRPVKKEFGTRDGWGWESGGKVTIPAGKVKLSLRDLTGFEGRLDSIYLSEIPDPKLPETTADILAWKDRVSGRAQMRVESEDFDVVITGGGITGCAAALAAESQGLKVALIQDRPVFGGNASEEIRVHTIGITGKNPELLNKINTKHWPNGDARAEHDQKKREATMAASSVRCYSGFLAIGVEVEGKTIKSVEAREVVTGKIKRFKAGQFIDCTGDGSIAHWAGAESRYGREASSEFDEAIEKYGETWSPAKADNKVMGTSVLWNSYIAGDRTDFPDTPWAETVALDKASVKGEWYWEYGANHLNQINDAEEIRDHMFRSIYGTFSNAKKSPKNALRRLKWVAYIGGRRESRRIIGDHILTMQDIANKTNFFDAVVEETRAVDVHYQLTEVGKKHTFLSKEHYFNMNGTYYVPFRSLFSKDLSNLMMAGRCMSCSHIALGGPRVMNTCGQMGIAVGYAASLCKKYKENPRAVGKDHIKELRKLIGYA